MLLKPPITTNEELYLQQVEWLRGEIERAVQAISANTLQVLEESLWRQEVLCVSLQRVVRTMVGTSVNSATMARVRKATADLQHLNKTYSRLIQQSKASCDLMYGLCRSYSEHSAREVPTSTGAPYPLEA